LLVNDTSAVGTVGDNKLSLDEAIGLANGSLALGKLSKAERAQVQGTPGPGTADLIKVALSRGTVISAQAALSVIRGNTDDTIDGNGVTLSGNGAGTALTISSSGFTVKDLTIKGFEREVAIDPRGESLHDITVHNVHLDPAPGGALMVGSTKSNGSLNKLTVTDCVFDGGKIDTATALKALTGPDGVFNSGGTTGQSGPSLLSVGIAAGIANSSSTVSNTSLDNVLFAHNKVINGFEGMYVFGGLVSGGEVDHSITQHVQLLDNEFSNVVDASLNAIGTEGIGSGSDNGVEDLTIAGNNVMALDWGIALWGGETFGDGRQQENYVRGADIHGNTVVGAAGPALAGAKDCIDLEGAWTTIRNGVQAGSSISDVRVDNNHVSGNCTVGIKLTGGEALLPPGAVTAGNSVDDVSIQDNDVRGAAIGLEMEGGYSPAPVGALVAGNNVRAVDVAQNHFVGNGSGTGHMVGGDSLANSVVTANSVQAVTFERNVVQGYPTACASVVNAGSQADGNYNSVTCPQS
jgi:hypothetical protein